MAATAAPRKTVSIYDYPEHLNPFHEEDNHNKIRFWTLGKKLSRSNSITFSGIKDLKNSWALRSFMRKGKKSSQTSSQTNKTNHQTHDEPSPIMYRRAMQYSSTNTLGARNTVGGGERYVYGGSVTPLPRSRFQERLRSPSQCEVNTDSTTPRMARSEVMGSRLSVESTNPFDGDPVPPIRASRRKKKRAPLPPPALRTTAEVVVSEIAPNTSPQLVEDKKHTSSIHEELDKINYDVELKIVEDEDVNTTPTQPNTSSDTIEASNETKHATPVNQDRSLDREKSLSNGYISKESFETKDKVNRKADSDDGILSQESFPKIDIIKYRRNSSLNEDDIRLRRGNLEDFHLSNQRSKSLSNALNGSYLVYDINLNLNEKKQDTNGNEKPKKVICKLYDETPRKESLDNSMSSTEKEFLEIDKATRELEKEISKLNSALNDDDDVLTGARLSVSDIRRKFDKNESNCPNPIPKPRRSHYGGSGTPITENVHK